MRRFPEQEVSKYVLVIFSCTSADFCTCQTLQLRCSTDSLREKKKKQERKMHRNGRDGPVLLFFLLSLTAR